MKKLITIILLTLGLQFGAKAQWVTIPDANFVAYLQAHFPSCMNGNLMDTTCSGITGATFVNCSNLSIADLTGIQYFDGLTKLNCSLNQIINFSTLPNNLTYFNCTIANILSGITSLPTLPNSLDTLICDNNQLASLPTLPSSLITLDCNQNYITNLPTLPPSLKSLNCSTNGISSLLTLPSSLHILICDNNQLTSLPSLPNTIDTLSCNSNMLSVLPTLPNSLTYFQCGANQLTSLPTLPSTLLTIYCGSNQISSLPNLPNSLLGLDCDNNLITSLPALPNTLGSLTCNNNSLTSLPSLPPHINWLVCNNNQLTSIPAIPSTSYLMELDCSNNNISCFPVFPNLNYYLNISNNPFHCLPNYVSAMNVNPSNFAYPLCTTGDLVNNPNNCPSTFGIVGYTYKDNNGDCIKNSGDSLLKNISISIYDSTYNTNTQSISFTNGIYDFPEFTGGYNVRIDTTGLPYQVQCIYPGIDSSVTLTTSNPLAQAVNFSVNCKPGFDIGVQSVVPFGLVFPGQQHQLKFVAGDLSNWYNLHCASGISGQVSIVVSGPVTYISPTAGALTPSSISGTSFTYNISDFGLLNSSGAFGLVLLTNTTATSSDTICVNISVTPTNGDNNTNNNTYNYCYHVINSYDPNYKETYPEQVQPGFNDYFNYTIHFQNTGNASAINIALTDALDYNLDFSTFQVVNYSHVNSVTRNGNQLLFHFNNINLADSTSNFAGSQGFVQYRIKPLTNLPAGTLIHNQASIYFDYNAPVVTNTTVNTFVGSAGIANNQHPASIITIAPNPFTSQTTITFTEIQKNTTLKITDVLGKEIKTINFSGKQCTIEKGEMLPGIYFVRIEDSAKNIVNKKIVVQ